MDLTDKVKAIIKAEVSGRAAVAVSGGRDSMCLLDCLLRFSLVPAEDLVVLHVNHMIRGAEADADEKLVEEVCRGHGVRFECTRADVPSLAKEHGRSVETEARIVRRGVFGAFGGIVMTAHTKTDRTESVLMHIFRGCGINGLTGPTERDGFLVRPLIDCTREEINEYVRRYRVPYSDDRTNADSDYARNYIRNKVLPLVRSRYPGLDDAVSRLGDTAKLISVSDGVKREADGSAVADAEGMNGSRALAAMLAAGLATDYTSAHIRAVTELEFARTGAGADLPHGFRAERESRAIRIYRKEDLAGCEAPFALGRTDLPGGRYVLAERTDERVDRHGCVIDLGKVPEGAVLRTRRDGDVFVPCGGIRKSLSDWLIDKKIPRYLRSRLLYLAAGGEVLAVAGMAAGAAVATDEYTKDAVRITAGRDIGDERA